MDLRNYRHLIMFGGSFDPPHRAHIVLPQQVREQLGADVVVYVPAGRAPHKLEQEQTPPEHRLAMLRRALEGVEHAIILTDEIDRAADGSPSYTIDTLVSLDRQLAPGAKMRLLIGADQVRIFDTWKAADRIEALAPPVVMVRPPDTAESLLAELPPGLDRSAWARRLVEVPTLDISSTQVRERVARGEPIDDLVPSGVAAYIREHGLYREQA